jgi:hypothetical protein
MSKLKGLKKKNELENQNQSLSQLDNCGVSSCLQKKLQKTI